MTKKELIEFGLGLVAKGRTPSEIHNTIAGKVTNRDELNDVLNHVFISESPKTNRKPERTKILLAANRKKINFEYSVKGLLRIAIVILIFGGVTYGLSKEDVNQNQIFGITTLLQGLLITLIYLLVKFKKIMTLLLPAVIVYFTIWIIELTLWGMPNDLLEAYNHVNLNTPPNFKLKSNTGGARMIGFIFPYLYLSLKLLLGWFIFVAYRNQYRYEALLQEVKDDLKDF